MSSYDENTPVEFTDGTQMDIHGIPMIIEEPLRNKYSRFAIFMGIIIIILVIMLIITIVNIKKHKKERTHAAQNLYNQYLHERDLCKVLHGKSNPAPSKFVEILIDPSSFTNITANNLSDMITYLIAVDRAGENSMFPVSNSEWEWTGTHWKTLLNLNDIVHIRSVTLVPDINILSQYSSNDTFIVTVILRNKLGNMIWQKTGGYIKTSSINIEIDKDLYI